MFGRGHFQNGVIIDPRKDFVFDPKDETRLADFRNAIWCVVQWIFALSVALRVLHKGPLLNALTPLRPHIPDYSKKFVVDAFCFFLSSNMTPLIR
jgi:hypothetical protein